ncbi:MAG: aminotransferase class I/II-fold pyridoxal phosphate-dependent enzyme [Vicinamibacterales bacterium]|nr:aminotransferase class I/II-fold pyridoxal phosphate-dependent enzyme [Vicinamibacterales bacterium]
MFPFIRHHKRAPDVRSDVVDFGGHGYEGINLASQDYLGLARHPEVIAAAVDACMAQGTHSAGSEPMGGGLAEAQLLEAELADFLRVPHVVLFPTGWGAGYGAIKALVRPYDHILIDALAHDCLQHGARSSGATVIPFAHNDVVSLERRLRRIQGRPVPGGVLVVTESLFSMDSDHPDFETLGETCRAHGAQLLVDCAHDLGVLGPSGRGVLAESGTLGKVDILVGSFSKTFACLGGFVATRSRAASYYVRGFGGTHTFSNYLMPAQIAAVRASLRIVRSDEGERLRREALRKAALLREALEPELEVMGRLSPVVLATIGSEATARLAQRECLRRGVIVNSIEFPACRRGQARFRLQASPRHADSDLQTAASIIVDSVSDVVALSRGNSCRDTVACTDRSGRAG